MAAATHTGGGPFGMLTPAEEDVRRGFGLGLHREAVELARHVELTPAVE